MWTCILRSVVKNMRTIQISTYRTKLNGLLEIILLSIYYFFNHSSDFICDFWTKTNFSIKLKIENFKNKNLRVTNGMKKRRENHAVEHVVKTWHKFFVVTVSI